jgi:hypothetical protein
MLVKKDKRSQRIWEIPETDLMVIPESVWIIPYSSPEPGFPMDIGGCTAEICSLTIGYICYYFPFGLGVGTFAR